MTPLVAVITGDQVPCKRGHESRPRTKSPPEAEGFCANRSPYFAFQGSLKRKLSFVKLFANVFHSCGLPVSLVLLTVTVSELLNWSAGCLLLHLRLKIRKDINQGISENK